MEAQHSKIKSLAKAIDILDTLSGAKRGMSLSELSARCGFPKSTAHAIISTLRDRGLIRQLPDGCYTLGMRLFEYGSAVSRGLAVSAIARPYLESLSALTGSNAVITLLDNQSAVSFDYAVSPSGIRILPEIGVRLPLHCTSQGKLLLAYLDRRSVISMYKRLALTSYTPHTIADIEHLQDELDRTAEQGYAIEDGEYKVGLRSISAPVFDATGELRYALTTIGFFRRVNSDDFSNAVACTVRQAQMLSAALGHRE